MINLEDKISAFSKLGNEIQLYLQNYSSKFNSQFDEAIARAKNENPWFTDENIKLSLSGMVQLLDVENLKTWTQKYTENENIKTSKTVGVIMAGNIPFVGFHDMLSVLISDCIFNGKLSSKDTVLPKAIVNILIEIEPKFKNKIIFTEGQIQNFDSIIATGSNNSSRYFDYYFGKYPNIIRKNRNSVAILTGNESENDLKNLGTDVFSYFGLGCRNVSKIFVPQNYDFKNLFEAFESFSSTVASHYKYFNNYEYNKAIYLVNQTKHFDNGFLIIKEDFSYSSPISVLYFEFYADIRTLFKKLKHESENIQCIVSSIDENHIKFGETQKPNLWDYADNIDTLEFLKNYLQ